MHRARALTVSTAFWCVLSAGLRLCCVVPSLFSRDELSGHGSPSKRRVRRSPRLDACETPPFGHAPGLDARGNETEQVLEGHDVQDPRGASLAKGRGLAESEARSLGRVDPSGSPTVQPLEGSTLGRSPRISLSEGSTLGESPRISLLKGSTLGGLRVRRVTNHPAQPMRHAATSIIFAALVMALVLPHASEADVSPCGPAELADALGCRLEWNADASVLACGGVGGDERVIADP